MRKKTLFPISALMMALLLALVAAMTPFVVEPDRVHAQEASDDSTLSNLTLNVGKLDSPFMRTNYDYAVSVPAGTNSIRVTATPNIQGAQVKLFYSDSTFTADDQQSMPAGATLASGNTVPLPANSTRYVGIEVTALGHTETDQERSVYRVDVTRISADASDDAKLSDLTISAGTLSPAFKPDVMSYTALVATDQGTAGTAFTVTPTLSDPDGDVNPAGGATFVITSSRNDTRLEAAGTMPLSVGQNVITIKVTAENLVTKETYTLTVTRAASNASDDARLSALMVGGESVNVSGFVGVDSDTAADAAHYITGVANGVSSMAISATANHSGAIVVIETGSDALQADDDAWTVDADGMVDLEIGDNNILIEVTAEDGSSVGNYFLVITRAAASASSDAKLSAENGLTLSGITISPAFSRNTMMYSAEVPINIASTTVTATGAADDTSTVGVADAATSVVISSDRDDDIDMDANDAPHIAEHTIQLSGGDNVITIMVTAADYETTETYTVRISRGVSDDARLSSLSLMTMPTEGTGEAIDLKDMDGMTAEFTADTMMYYADVDAGVDMIEVMATAMDSDATVSGDGAVSLDVGENTITVTVTAEDGTTMMTYTVTVTVLMGGTLLDRYDANTNDQIDKNEAVAAIRDYIAGHITKADVVEVIRLYITG